MDGVIGPLVVTVVRGAVGRGVCGTTAVPPASVSVLGVPPATVMVVVATVMATSSWGPAGRCSRAAVLCTVSHPASSTQH